MEVVTSMLANRPLAEIAVREIAEAANISEMTFFNYFPTKNDVIAYFVQTWSVRVQWDMARVVRQTGSQLQAIETLFTTTASLVVHKPGVMSEIVAFHALDRSPLSIHPMSAEEYALLFPARPAIEQIAARSIGDIFHDALQEAVASGELPPGSDIDLVVISLVNIFFGTPVLACREEQDPSALYQQQLTLLWRGLRARG